MIQDKKVLAVIPARGGSKRLPKKNLLPLSGKPLIAWTIEAARNSHYIDHVLVSTDCQDIADIAVEYGAHVPELRPEELSSDVATTESVLFYSLGLLEKDYDIVLILQPTSPLRNEVHIDEACELFMYKNAFSVVSVTQCEHSPLWANTLPESGSMGEFIRPEALKRSQDLDKYYRINGAIYIFDVHRLREYEKICYIKDSFSFIMESNCSVDIDNYSDFKWAEFVKSEATKL